MFHLASDQPGRAEAQVQREPARRRRGPRVVGIMLASAAAITILPATAFAASPAKKLTPLQKGLAFYKGQTLSMYTYGPAGSGVDLTGRDLAPYIGAYLHATVNVVNLPTANGVTEQDALAHAVPNGLTFGQLNVATDISAQIANTTLLNFNPERLAFIGSSKSGSSVWISSPSSPYSNWKTIQKATSPVTMLDTTTGDGNIRLRTVNGVFGINANIVTGYTNTAALIAGFIRGDGPVTESSLSVMAPLILAGQARPILLTTLNKFTPALAAKLKGVPTLADISAAYPPKQRQKLKALSALLGLLKVGTVNAMPAAVPSDRQLALRAAFEAASKNATVQQEVLNAGSSPGWISGANAKAYWIDIASNTASIATYVNG